MWKKFLVALSLLMAHAAFAAVEVNKADQAGLESVKGIGPSMSTRILDERKKGAFKDWPDLVDRVKGIGEGNANRFSKEGLTVNGSQFTAAVGGSKGDKKTGFGKKTATQDEKKPAVKDPRNPKDSKDARK